MKGRKIVYFILMFLPLVATLVLLPLFPEQIPAHYGADGLVTRWGSKWELIILPAATLLMAGFFPLVAKLVRAAEPGGKNNEKVLLISGCATLLLFNVMAIDMVSHESEGCLRSLVSAFGGIFVLSECGFLIKRNTLQDSQALFCCLNLRWERKGCRCGKVW